MRRTLLPLAGLVAFPFSRVALSTRSEISEGPFGLIHSRQDGQLARVGVFATAESAERQDDCHVLLCTATERFRIVEQLEDADGLPVAHVEPFEDEPFADAAAAAEAAALCSELRSRIQELAALQARVEGAVASVAELDLPPDDSPTAFSLALAGVVEHEAPAEAQALLESTCTLERLRRLDEAVRQAVQFTSTQAMLVLFTSSLLYYSGDGAEGFESIPATMYLSILMLTGQGEPDGELTTLLKSLCAFTAIFSVAMVAIPASMLTFGFEIEAQRLVLKRRERRLRRRIRAERLENHWIESCSDSEDGDAQFLARERNKRLCRGRADASDLSSSEEEYETLVLGETQEATLERVRRELQAKQAQYDSLLRAMEDAPPAVL